MPHQFAALKVNRAKGPLAWFDLALIQSQSRADSQCDWQHCPPIYG
ncbi:Uncharacterised protein [Vibrio cholerae]|nr:Uncharacterised protein [Vibrio cholerae]